MRRNTKQAGIGGTTANTNGKAKTEFPMTKREFLDSAPPLKMTIGGRELIASPREFSSGSVGFYFSDKVTIEVNGKAIRLQIGANATCIGSKEAN
jgi:hypothetical protein